ncbi:hypothetical protein ACMDCR_24210 [Labrys okinawensis]|uniref:hypothetical protein n=1 Tax=Labrys okinawensis TaxID=346911 RepID=UPI0039BD5AC6
MDKSNVAGEDIQAALSAHRQAAALDLLSRIPDRILGRIAVVRNGHRPPAELLRHRFPGAELTMVDLPKHGHLTESSPPNGSFPESTGMNIPQPPPFDLIFSNGLPNVSPDFRQLILSLLDWVGLGGFLAIQTPNNLYEPYRIVMRMIAIDGPWAPQLLSVAKTRPFNETAEGLYDLLASECSLVKVWETTIVHVTTVSRRLPLGCRRASWPRS